MTSAKWTQVRALHQIHESCQCYFCACRFCIVPAPSSPACLSRHHARTTTLTHIPPSIRPLWRHCCAVWRHARLWRHVRVGGRQARGRGWCWVRGVDGRSCWWPGGLDSLASTSWSSCRRERTTWGRSGCLTRDSTRTGLVGITVTHHP